jgi:GH15 family glucan-1,4-alpha-glucosidase
MAYKPIKSYGVIGDLHTVALVSIDGSIDRCCLPQFDSPSNFAAILDERKELLQDREPL